MTHTLTRTLHLTQAPFTHDQFADVDWDDLNSVHKTVMGLFPHVESDSPRAELGILFRVEHATGRVLIQSSVAPTSTEGLASRPIPDPSDVFTPGTTFHARVRLNPVKTVWVDPNAPRTKTENKRTRRYIADQALLNEAIQVAAAEGRPEPTELDLLEDWASQKVPFPVEEITCVDTALTHARRSSDKVPIFTATFDVTGTIGADPVTFHDAIRHGIGKARAYGCGLITAIPVD